jgi:large subunit ribosomal protein L22
MTLSTAKLGYLRIAPRKARLVADLIRGKKIEEAQTILNFTNRRAAQPLLKLLKQAIFNAKNKFQIEPSDLYISKITVDEGPKLKRWMPRARGRTFEIQKKTSHIILELDSKTEKILKKRRIKSKTMKKKVEKEEVIKSEKSKFKPKIEIKKPKTKEGFHRVFKRKAF